MKPYEVILTLKVDGRKGWYVYTEWGINRAAARQAGIDHARQQYPGVQVIKADAFDYPKEVLEKDFGIKS